MATKRPTYRANRPDLTAKEDEELEEKQPDHHNIPQVLRNIADRVQSKEIDAKELAVAIDSQDGDVLVFGAGGPHVNMATTHFLFNRGAKALLDFADNDDGAGHA